jgi:hypothetical protein
MQQLRYRLPSGDGLVVRRLLVRDGFAVSDPESAERRTVLSVLVESEGRAARVREVMARWAPGATLLERG